MKLALFKIKEKQPSFLWKGTFPWLSTATSRFSWVRALFIIVLTIVTSATYISLVLYHFPHPKKQAKSNISKQFNTSWAQQSKQRSAMRPLTFSLNWGIYNYTSALYFVRFTLYDLNILIVLAALHAGQVPQSEESAELFSALDDCTSFLFCPARN